MLIRLYAKPRKGVIVDNKGKEPNGNISDKTKENQTSRIESENAFLREKKVNSKSEFSKIENNAKEYVEGKKNIGRLLNEALEKAEKSKGLLGKILDDLIVLFRLVKAWSRGKYGKMPIKSISLTIAALLYFVNPFDVIPDFIPAIGYLDDVALIAAGVQAIRGDLSDFKNGKKP